MNTESQMDDRATQTGDSEQEGTLRVPSPRHSRESRRMAGHFGDYVRRSHTIQSEPNYSSSSGLRNRNTSRNQHNHNQVDPVLVASGRTPEYGEQGFSLAGAQDPQSQSRQTNQHQPYIEPGYGDLNPAYDQPGNSRPVWALSKPLPRIIRRGMRPSQDELDVTGNLNYPKAGEEDEDFVQPTDSELEKGIRPSYNVHKLSRNLKDSSQKREQNYFQKFGKKLEPPSAAGQDSQTQPFGPIQELPNKEDHEAKEGDLGIPRPPVEPLNQDPPEEKDETNVEDEDQKEEEEDYSDLDDERRDSKRPETEDHVPLTWVAEEIHNHHTHWSVLRTKLREPLAETLAVIVQMTLGICLDLAHTVSASNSADTSAWGWGLATMTGVYIAGGVSGGHLNPAVTITLYIFRGFPHRKIPAYIFAQLFGAYIAGLISYGIYRNFIVEYLAQNGATGIIDVENAFITDLRGVADAASGFFTELIAGAFLGVVILALGDDSNAPPGAGMNAFILGLVIAVEIMAFAPNTGAALNPTRDLGPRLALITVGFGRRKLFGDPWWVYGAWCGPVLGMLVGAALYDVAIFVGGESPINYPRRRIKRTGMKAKKRWKRRIGRKER